MTHETTKENEKNYLLEPKEIKANIRKTRKK